MSMLYEHYFSKQNPFQKQTREFLKLLPILQVNIKVVF